MKRILGARFLMLFLSTVGGVSVALAQTLVEPSDVENVVATPGNASVLLEWDPATDDGSIISYRVSYGVASVTEEGQSYDDDINTRSSDTSFEVTNLINNNTYYFAVTAIDDQGLESVNYSVEVAATPTGGGSSDSAPFLQSAVHSAQDRILVIMSEPVQVDDPNSAFEVSEDFSGETVDILNTLVNSQQVTLIVDREALLEDNIYWITATTGVTDLEGNPVSSGVVDSVQFTAKGPQAFVVEETPEDELLEDGAQEEELLIEEEDVPPPVVVQEPSNVDTFFLDDSNDNSETADFLDALLNPDNPINNLNPEDVSGPEVPSVEETNQPMSPTQENNNQNLSAAPDQIPPQDARNLAADTSSAASGQVTVTWQPAVDLDSDIQDQVLYTRVGLGTWDNGLSLGKNISQTSLTVQPNQNYQIRLVTVDTAGNESFGAAFEFSTTLNQSGGGQTTVIALTVLTVLGMLFMFGGARRA